MPLELYIKEERQYVCDIYSLADDLSWMARYDDFYEESVHKIASLVNSIPEKEAAEKEQLSVLVDRLVNAVCKDGNELHKECISRRYQSVKYFREKLEQIYHLEFGFKLVDSKNSGKQWD